MSAGQIHDLGYKRYVGSRSSVGTRWTVIMRHQLSTAWKTWWRFKVWLIAAFLVTAVIVSVLIIMHGEYFPRIGRIGGLLTTYADALLPYSTEYYCKVGFFVSLTLSSTVVAGDVQSGAFTFYFARSLRPRDYVVGKLIGLGILMSLIMLAGPFLLAGLRLGLSDDLDQLLELLPIVFKMLAIGVLGTLTYAAVPLGFSALITNRRYAMALWAAYYVVIGSMAAGIGFFTTPALAALDLAAALKAVSLNLFDMQWSGRNLKIPTSVALISILGHTAIAIGLVFWRVRNAQQTGVGGSS